MGIKQIVVQCLLSTCTTSSPTVTMSNFFIAPSGNRSLALLFFILTTHLNLSHSRHHTGIRHKRQHNGNIYLPESFIIPGGSGADGDDWGPWGSPSECSRTCGGGVAYQTRECYNYGPDGQPSCGGGNKKYFSCNTQDCPDDEIDFRKQQCSTFDLMPFEGARYKWTPYTKAPNPCELNCMPVNERFYYRHKAKVIDGTRCNEESYNICVDGTCQPVGCDLMLGSEAREDKCRTCQGDGSSCRTIDGDLDMNNLQVGYNDMLLIPSGATNIEIFERAPSNNYLAIRNVTGFYYLNGYYKIDFPRALNFAGSAWHYERRTQGFAAPDKLTCMGPTTESVYLVLLSQDKNVGIHYEYSIPSKAAINPIPDTYFWSFTDFTPCSASCGGGTQSRNVTCNIRNSLEEVDNGLCDASSKPAEVQKCGTEACAPHWSDKPWSKCSKPCGSEGTQEREVKCQRVSVDGVAEEIEDSVCLNSVGNKPATVQSCNQDLICAQWHLGTWLPCNKLCGEGEQTRKVTCYRRENGKTTVLTDADCLDEKPEEKKKCLVKPCEGVDYVTSSWSGCSECGQTVETRTAICATKDGVKYDDKYCENRVKPELSRPCKAPACDFQWFSSQWSKCSAVCGKGVQSRKVVCGKFDGEFIKRADDESKCDESAKPENEKPCETAEDACPGQWFSGPWSECSKKCGDGEKTRKVLCIFNGTVSSAKNCDEEKIEFTTEKCNTFPCVDDDLLPVDVTSTPIMEDDEGEEYCDEDEDDIETEDSSLEDTGVTNAMTSADDLDLGSSVDMDSAGTTESSLLTDELMLSDSTYETAATDDSATMLPDTSSSDAEGSGSSPITLDSRFAEGSGDDAESAGTSDDSTVTSDGATDDVSVTSVAPGASDASPVSGDSSDATTIASAVSDDVVTLSSISASSSAAIVDTTTLMSVTDASEAASSELTTTEESTTPTETTPEATTETSEAITTTVDDMTTTNMPEMTTVEAGVATTEADAGATTIAPAEAAAPETDYDVPSRIGADDDTTASPVDVSTDSSVDASTVSSADSSTVASGSSEATVTDGSAATSDSSSDATDVTESSAKDSTESTVDMTTETDVEGTTVDIWTTTSDGSSSDTSDSDSTDMDGTTPNTLVSAIVKELTPRKCKPRPKIPVCIKSPFGCCADNFTAAKGPFDEGCPVAETCKDTKYGCCPDNVSPAAGHKNKGCPPPLCESSLFGCCSDKITPAEGEEKEGCPIEVTTVGGCAASKFGCCPDGVSEAKGKKNAGCAKDEVTTIKPTTAKSAEPEAKPDEKDCNNSLNGCCDDGVTAATGPNKAGCSTCASELFGCCPDRETPAHGPHGEGCCLSSPYGCCPDNMKEARGPQLEGCSCEYTTYGCCPDNKTTALSSSYEGCGCKYSPYGCCPDRVTEARGEKFEGCPCSAFQFGCCPDGETPAKGPQSQGCHCSQSEFKCCSDNVTPAKGPSMEGCTCATSQFGCCPDGHSEAKGKNFEECENVLESPQKACSLKRDMGSCNNFTVKHFYDAEYGGCSRFWYGGCEGNKNRFETIEECKSICEQPTGKDVCQLPKNSGPCKGYYPMYYYDNERNACTQFIYGGCLGNANRFETIEECKTSCAVDDSSVQCEQPRDEGPCAGSFERWYYNKQDDRCEPFHYGGCKGNKNNFASEGACKYSCQSPGAGKASCDLPSQTGGCDKKYARWFYSKDAKACAPFYFTGCDGNENNYRSLDECERECAPAVEKDMCFLPAEIGDCQNYVANWYYDTKEARCRQFYYGGCGGNGNNFPTEEACSKRCTEKAEVIPPSRPVAPVEAPPRFGTDEEPEDYCLGPKDAGNCEDYVERYYFDNRRKSCHAFTYTGCGGNHNNFASLAECSSSCAHLAEPETTHGPVRKPEPSADICILPEEPGNCSNYSIAFHYNSRDSTCSAFHYSGCGGNANNFNSMEQCERRCGEFKGIDVCQQEQDPGRCDQFSSRFAYNAATRRCVEFSYGGCEGNGNRFDTERECEEECQRAEEPAEPENAAICRLPAEAGECYDNNDEYIERWYYEPYYQTCVTFSYSGCTGNQNNFRSFESCSNFCMSKHEPEPARDNCYSFEQECRRLSCSYGLAKSYDPETNCEKCSCHYPCQDYGCPENHRCSIEMQKNPETGESEFVPFCSEIEKPGRCPHHLNNTECSVHCYTDADCRGNYKCCKAGCSSLCVPPIDDNAATQGPPVHVAGAQAPQLEEVPEEEVNVAHEEGGVAVLRCFATGYPPPSITWKRGGLILNTNQGRFILTSNGDLQIVQLHRTDSGTYVCVADNGVGLSVTRDVNLTVADPVEREAYIVGEANTTMIAKLNQPATLRCLAGGYPKPSVYWWRGSNLLPLSAENFEVNRDYSLVFNRLQLSDLGKYLCEAYTGKGKPITLTITLKTVGPVQPVSKEDEQYMKFVISPDEVPTTPRPAPPRRPVVIVPQIRDPIPLNTSVILPNGRVTYDVGGDLSLECAVSGYPIPKVVWFKDGRQLQESDRVQISDSNRLVVRELSTTDSGRYSCVAKNDYSEASDEKSIYVEGVYVPQNCTDNPFFANCKLIVQAQYCTHKYYAVFCCKSCTLAGQLNVGKK